MSETLTDKDKAQVLEDLGLLNVVSTSGTMPADPQAVYEVVAAHTQAHAEEITLPNGLVPSTWVIEQFDAHKGRDGDGRSREQRSAYNKALYKKLQDMRTHHNAQVKRDMKADQIAVVSDEVKRRVRESNARTSQPVEIPDELLEAAAQQLAERLVQQLRG